MGSRGKTSKEDVWIMVKVLGKVKPGSSGITLILDFYLYRGEGKGWYKTNGVILSRSNKRFNLHRLFSLYSSRIEYTFSHFKTQEKIMWERWFEVKDEEIKEKFGLTVESISAESKR